MNPDRLQRLAAQPLVPAYDPQLIAPAGQHRRYRYQPQAGQRIPPARRTPVVRHQG